MQEYYKSDEKSIQTLRNLSPHKTVIMPDIWIFVSAKKPAQVWINCVWPRGQISKVIEVNSRVVQALRRLYKSVRGGWEIVPGLERTGFHKRGGVSALASNHTAQVDPAGLVL
jgi:hypothetical protein